MTRSRIFELSDLAAAALSRHEGELDAATTDQRKRAKNLFIEHGENLFLAMILADERAAENRRTQIEHDARVKAERIAARVDAWASSSVAAVDGLARFFTATLGGAITTADHAGQRGNKAASALPGEAVTDLKNQRSEKLFFASLPAGVLAIRADAGMMDTLRSSWALPSTCTWEINGMVYSLYSGTINRDVDCGSVAFLRTVKCGTGAAWIVKPSEVQLDADGRLPALPDAVADALSSCGAGSEKLLERFLFS